MTGGGNKVDDTEIGQCIPQVLDVLCILYCV